MSRRGRPAVTPTPEERQKVKEMVGGSVPISDIAKILGRSVPTVRKYFLRELFSGKKIKQKAAPAFEVTALHRVKVKRYEGYGMPREKIALVIGCTLAELESLFAEELKVARAEIRAKYLDAVDEKVDEGAREGLIQAKELTAEPQPGAVGPNGYVAKKTVAAAAAAAAGAPGGRFATRPPPKLVVDNSQ